MFSMGTPSHSPILPPRRTPRSSLLTRKLFDAAPLDVIFPVLPVENSHFKRARVPSTARSPALRRRDQAAQSDPNPCRVASRAIEGANAAQTTESVLGCVRVVRVGGDGAMFHWPTQR